MGLGSIMPLGRYRPRQLHKQAAHSKGVEQAAPASGPRRAHL